MNRSLSEETTMRPLALLTVAALASGLAAQPVVNELAELSAPGLDPADSFGNAMVITDQALAVSATGDGDAAMNAGAVYFFNTQSYAFERKVVPPTGEPTQRFGSSLASFDNAVYVGAPFAWDGDEVARGKVYQYGSNGIGPVAAYEPQPITPTPNEDLFGWSIAAESGYVAIGAPGDDRNGNFAGVVYIYPGASQLVLAQPDDAAEWDRFGWAVAVDGEILVVGAPSDAFNGPSAGAVYLFEADTGDQILKIPSPYGAPASSDFGRFVDIRGNRIIVGAARADVAGTIDVGQLFSYTFDAVSQTVSLDGVLNDPTPANNDRFGFSGAIGNSVTVVGTPSNDPTGESFVFSNGVGSAFAQFRPSDTSGLGQFGDAIDSDGQRFAIGAPNSSGGGRAFVFERPFEILVQPRDFLAVPTELIEIGIDLGVVQQPVTYLWRRDGIALTADDGVQGLNTPVISFIADRTRDGLYDCVVTSGSVQLKSDPALVAVRDTCPADQNNDGLATPADFNAWILNYNRGCD
jgi:hypothetical protein